MTLYKPRQPVSRLLDSPSGDSFVDFRARAVQTQAEAAERRRAELADQCSSLKSPEERIRLWEVLHAVTLPKSPEHPLVEVIATDTRLTGVEVRSEQQRRAAAKAAAL